jgi:hypothetical protein
MVTQQNNHSASCPTCEFTRGVPGNPRFCPDGTMICITCNSKWRDLTKATGSEEIPNVSSNQYSQQPDYLLPASAISQPSLTKISGSSKKYQPAASSYFKSASLYLTGLGTIVILITVLVYQIFPLTNSSQRAKTSTNQLALDNIKVENIRYSNTPIWIISARISNHSENTLPVPPILMSSGEKGTSGYFGWTYKPALQKLAPGSNLIIRSSMRKPVGSSKKVKLEFIGNLDSG